MTPRRALASLLGVCVAALVAACYRPTPPETAAKLRDAADLLARIEARTDGGTHAEGRVALDALCSAMRDLDAGAGATADGGASCPK